jgi:hypothetical protein
MRTRLFSLTDAQLAQLKAAAATLRVDQRDVFLRDVARELSRHDRAPTDAEFAIAIANTIGVTAVTQAFLCEKAKGQHR